MEICVAEVRLDELRPAELRPFEVRSTEVRSTEIRLAKVLEAEIWQNVRIFPAPPIPSFYATQKQLDLLLIRHVRPPLRSLVTASIHKQSLRIWGGTRWQAAPCSKAAILRPLRRTGGMSYNG